MPNTTWKTPTPWSANQLVTANDMNIQINEQLLALKNPATNITTSSTTQTTTSNVLVLIPGLSTNLTVAGGDVMLRFCGAINNLGSGNTYINLAFKVNNDVYDIHNISTPAGGSIYASLEWFIPSSYAWLTPLNTAVQNFRVLWRSSTSQQLQLAGQYQFVVREVS